MPSSSRGGLPTWQSLPWQWPVLCTARPRCFGMSDTLGHAIVPSSVRCSCVTSVVSTIRWQMQGTLEERETSQGAGLSASRSYSKVSTDLHGRGSFAPPSSPPSLHSSPS
eukprot:scaffold672_cov268-Pinguiococcus_pyrenoidosus.AAC.8